MQATQNKVFKPFSHSVYLLYSTTYLVIVPSWPKQCEKKKVLSLESSHGGLKTEKKNVQKKNVRLRNLCLQ